MAQYGSPRALRRVGPLDNTSSGAPSIMPDDSELDVKTEFEPTLDNVKGWARAAILSSRTIAVAMPGGQLEMLEKKYAPLGYQDVFYLSRLELGLPGSSVAMPPPSAAVRRRLLQAGYDLSDEHEVASDFHESVSSSSTPSTSYHHHHHSQHSTQHSDHQQHHPYQPHHPPLQHTHTPLPSHAPHHPSWSRPHLPSVPEHTLPDVPEDVPCLSSASSSPESYVQTPSSSAALLPALPIRTSSNEKAAQPVPMPQTRVHFAAYDEFLVDVDGGDSHPSSPPPHYDWIPGTSPPRKLAGNPPNRYSLYKREILDSPMEKTPSTPAPPMRPPRPEERAAADRAARLAEELGQSTPQARERPQITITPPTLKLTQANLARLQAESQDMRREESGVSDAFAFDSQETGSACEILLDPGILKCRRLPSRTKKSTPSRTATSTPIRTPASTPSNESESTVRSRRAVSPNERTLRGERTAPKDHTERRGGDKGKAKATAKTAKEGDDKAELRRSGQEQLSQLVAVLDAPGPTTDLRKAIEARIATLQRALEDLSDEGPLGSELGRFPPPPGQGAAFPLSPLSPPHKAPPVAHLPSPLHQSSAHNQPPHPTPPPTAPPTAQLPRAPTSAPPPRPPMARSLGSDLSRGPGPGLPPGAAPPEAELPAPPTAWRGGSPRRRPRVDPRSTASSPSVSSPSVRPGAASPATSLGSQSTFAPSRAGAASPSTSFASSGAPLTPAQMKNLGKFPIPLPPGIRPNAALPGMGMGGRSRARPSDPAAPPNPPFASSASASASASGYSPLYSPAHSPTFGRFSLSRRGGAETPSEASFGSRVEERIDMWETRTSSSATSTEKKRFGLFSRKKNGSSTNVSTAGASKESLEQKREAQWRSQRYEKCQKATEALALLPADEQTEQWKSFHLNQVL